MSAAVYFIRPVDALGPVKVGYATDVSERLSRGQAFSPLLLEVAATVPAETRREGQAIERRFHERYLPWHLHHEWFAHNELLATDMAAIIGGTFDLSVLPICTIATWHLPIPQRIEA